MSVKIITNKQWRNILDWYELTPKEQAQFEYLDTALKQACASFGRYKGNVYNLGEFMRCPTEEFKAWHGYNSDTYFSGVLIRFSRDEDAVMFGRYYS
jgi:hypothetical protein